MHVVNWKNRKEILPSDCIIIEDKKSCVSSPKNRGFTWVQFSCTSSQESDKSHQALYSKVHSSPRERYYPSGFGLQLYISFISLTKKKKRNNFNYAVLLNHPTTKMFYSTLFQFFFLKRQDSEHQTKVKHKTLNKITNPRWKCSSFCNYAFLKKLSHTLILHFPYPVLGSPRSHCKE